MLIGQPEWQGGNLKKAEIQATEPMTLSQEWHS